MRLSHLRCMFERKIRVLWSQLLETWWPRFHKLMEVFHYPTNLYSFPKKSNWHILMLQIYFRMRCRPHNTCSPALLLHYFYIQSYFYLLANTKVTQVLQVACLVGTLFFSFFLLSKTDVALNAPWFGLDYSRLTNIPASAKFLKLESSARKTRLS